MMWAGKRVLEDNRTLALVFRRDRWRRLPVIVCLAIVDKIVLVRSFSFGICVSVCMCSTGSSTQGRLDMP